MALHVPKAPGFPQMMKEGARVSFEKYNQTWSAVMPLRMILCYKFSCVFMLLHAFYFPEILRFQQKIPFTIEKLLTDIKNLYKTIIHHHTIFESLFSPIHSVTPYNNCRSSLVWKRQCTETSMLANNSHKAYGPPMALTV